MTKSVIIVGGGIAGLGAARELARNGVAVTILEAGQRLGGRIYTIHRGRLPIELGAEFIHGRDPALLKAIKEARLDVHQVKGGNHIFENGKLKDVDLWQDIDRIIRRIDPHRPDSSFAAFLAKQKLSPSMRSLAFNFAEGFNAAHADRISAHSILKGEYFADQMHGSWQGRVGWRASTPKTSGGYAHIWCASTTTIGRAILSSAAHTATSR